MDPAQEGTIQKDDNPGSGTLTDANAADEQERSIENKARTSNDINREEMVKTLMNSGKNISRESPISNPEEEEMSIENSNLRTSKDDNDPQDISLGNPECHPVEAKMSIGNNNVRTINDDNDPEKMMESSTNPAENISFQKKESNPVEENMSIENNVLRTKNENNDPEQIVKASTNSGQNILIESSDSNPVEENMSIENKNQRTINENNDAEQNVKASTNSGQNILFESSDSNPVEENMLIENKNQRTINENNAEQNVKASSNSGQNILFESPDSNPVEENMSIENNKQRTINKNNDAEQTVKASTNSGQNIFVENQQSNFEEKISIKNNILRSSNDDNNPQNISFKNPECNPVEAKMAGISNDNKDQKETVKTSTNSAENIFFQNPVEENMSIGNNNVRTSKDDNYQEEIVKTSTNSGQNILLKNQGSNLVEEKMLIENNNLTTSKDDNDPEQIVKTSTNSGENILFQNSVGDNLVTCVSGTEKEHRINEGHVPKTDGPPPEKHIAFSLGSDNTRADSDEESVDSSCDSSSSSSLSSSSSSSSSSSDDEMEEGDEDDDDDDDEVGLPIKRAPPAVDRPRLEEMVQVGSEGPLFLENRGQTNIPEFPNYRVRHDDSVDSSDDSSTESTSSSSSEAEGVTPTAQSARRRPQRESDSEEITARPRVRGEIFPEELPALENLNICVGDSVELQLLAKITSVIRNIAVAKAEFASPIDQDSVVFLQDRTCIGKVHDIFGPVQAPFYTILLSKEYTTVSVNTEVYCAPSEQEYTKYVFVNDLKNLKGSDASWEHDKEPPEKFLDFSDDEKERRMKKNKRCKNFANDDSNDDSNNQNGKSQLQLHSTNTKNWRKRDQKGTFTKTPQQSMFACSTQWPPTNIQSQFSSWPPPNPPPPPPPPSHPQFSSWPPPNPSPPPSQPQPGNTPFQQNQMMWPPSNYSHPPPDVTCPPPFRPPWRPTGQGYHPQPNKSFPPPPNQPWFNGPQRTPHWSQGPPSWPPMRPPPPRPRFSQPPEFPGIFP